MRIAGSVHVTLRAIQLAWNVELADKISSREIATLAGLDFGVARLLQQHRQPANLKFGPGAYHQISVARPRDQAGLGLNLVWVLQSAGSDRNFDQIAAKFLRQGTPFGLAGKHAQRGLRRSGQQHPWCDDQGKNKFSIHHEIVPWVG